MNDAIFKKIEKEKIKFIDLWFSDILGSVKSETIPVQHLKKTLKEGIWFDGSSVEGFGRICYHTQGRRENRPLHMRCLRTRPQTSTSRPTFDTESKSG
jgi:hypothetical protein